MEAQGFDPMADRDTGLGGHVWDDESLEGARDALPDLELDADTTGRILAPIDDGFREYVGVTCEGTVPPIGGEGEVPVDLIRGAPAHDGNI